jgi:hypothetical protein
MACSSIEGAPKPAADRKRQRDPPPSWPFPTDYLDHFSTTSEALRDLAVGLDLFAASLGKTRSSLKLYDPFYCDGSVAQRWSALGFRSVIHEKRDFYKDVASGSVPDHDIFVSNPPYSSDHKERVVSYCVDSAKPFALLLPNYVATKQHYRTAMAPLISSGRRPLYVVPTSRYQYLHPDGTGKPMSPFASIWYVHFGDLTDQIATAWQRQLVPSAISGTGSVAVALARSVEELAEAGKVPTLQRPSSKQRKRILKQRAASEAASVALYSGECSRKERHRTSSSLSGASSHPKDRGMRASAVDHARVDLSWAQK